MAPTLGNGKICYIFMSSDDVQKSAEFYKKVFGWNVRTRGDGSVSFDDGVGEVSGTWQKGLKPYDGGAMVVYIMVEDAEATIEKIKAAGGEIVQPIGGDPGEITARFRDPGGNVVAIYEQPNEG